MITTFRQRRWSAIAGSALLIFAAAPALAQQGQTWRSPDSAPDTSYDGSDYRDGGYSARETYSQGGDRYNESYSPNARGDNYRGGDSYARQPDPYAAGGSGAYSPGRRDPYAAGGDAYSPTRDRQHGYGESARPSDTGGYGEPYAPPPGEAAGGYGYGTPPPATDNLYTENEIVSAGHGFFGAISKGLAQGVEYAFKSQGRPNGYILGEDAGGAFVVGVRYGEGRLFTKDAGEHKVFWQGPSVGYDAGAEGSKTMVLVYNLRDPSEIYERFGGAEGSAYLVGGVSVQFQKFNDVTLAIIRSGVGLRLGANVGYLKYTRAPTWNPL